MRTVKHDNRVAFQVILMSGCLFLAACAPAPIPLATARPTLTATRTSAPTATLTPTPASILPEGPLRDLEATLRAAYTISPAPAGAHYELRAVNGEVVPELRLFEDGTAQLDYEWQGRRAEDLTVPFQVIGLDDDALDVGLWRFGDDQWSMETHPAPKTADEAGDWRALGVLIGHEREQGMIDTVFAARDLAMARSDTYDPADEFKDISIAVNFQTTDDFDVRPREWKYTGYGYADGDVVPELMGMFDFRPVSRVANVVYQDFSTLEHARPMQVALNGGWFEIQVYDDSDEPAFRAVHASTVAVDSDGKLRFLSAVLGKEDLPRITHVLTKEMRGKLWFRLCSRPTKSSSLVLLLANPSLIAFAARVNGPYFAEPSAWLTPVPSPGYGFYSRRLPSLPKALDRTFLLLSGLPSDFPK